MAVEVRELMNRNAYAVGVETNIPDAAELMNEGDGRELSGCDARPEGRGYYHGQGNGPGMPG